MIQTAFSGVVAYDLPGTADAVVRWGTGRGSYLRAGTPAAPPPTTGETIFADGLESGDVSAWTASTP